MSCLIFDRQTAKDLREASPGSLFRFESSKDPFSSALERQQCVLLLPALESGRAAVLQVKRSAEMNKQPAKALQHAEPQDRSHVEREDRQERRGEQPREPRGILGLDGDAVYLDEEELDQRSWWQRLFRS